MPMRRLAVLAVSALLLTSFSMPGRSVQAAHRVSAMRSLRPAATLTVSKQVQWSAPYHAGGCHEQDEMAYNPADD
jgi:hypothetical protein